MKKAGIVLGTVCSVLLITLLNSNRIVDFFQRAFYVQTISQKDSSVKQELRSSAIPVKAASLMIQVSSKYEGYFKEATEIPDVEPIVDSNNELYNLRHADKIVSVDTYAAELKNLLDNNGYTMKQFVYDNRGKTKQFPYSYSKNAESFEQLTKVIPYDDTGLDMHSTLCHLIDACNSNDKNEMGRSVDSVLYQAFINWYWYKGDHKAVQFPELDASAPENQEKNQKPQSPSQESENNLVPYSTYTNDRYGFSISYPSSFSLGNPPTNNDGRDITVPDNRFKIAVYGRNNVFNDTTASIFNSTVSGLGSMVKHKELNSTYFVIEWIDGDMEHYEKCVVGVGSENYLDISYPVSDKAGDAAMVSDIINTFKTPSVSQPH